MISETRQDATFHVTDTDFRYKGKIHQLNEIEHLFFYRWNVVTRVNAIKIGEDQHVRLRITLTDGKEIELSLEDSGKLAGLDFSNKKDINNIINLYMFLANKTFSSRAQFYIKQIQEKGYFTHENCQFVPGDKIVFRNKDFPIAAANF